jgi:hypothetical protein
MSTKRIYIDGQETRRRIGEMAGKAHGVQKICMERGLAKETVNQIIIKGYGSPATIDKCIKAGIPIKISDRPIPCRANREHSRNDNKNDTKNEYEKLVEALKLKKNPPRLMIPQPKQISIEDLAEAEQIKEILIDGLTAIIEALKKI